ncbi:MAG: RelA/SpoT domain-containing protein [Betaproteobacteria bacterium]|nr:RelA/SpoT domain-containing protein [Betaproteobacteria bacterium]
MIVPPPTEDELAKVAKRFKEEEHRLRIFGGSVREFFASHPELSVADHPAIHSVRFRVKNVDHLKEKIIRKAVTEGRVIDDSNLFTEITDLVGVRILHMNMEQFDQIHAAIMQQVQQGHWALFESPKAYSWDPESKKYFEDMGLETAIKESHYTSVHYVVKPNDLLSTTCEIQVRTLFEEVWGEIDHEINYPRKTTSVACREQLSVLAKMVGAGSRLVEAIFRSHGEHSAKSSVDGSQH